MIFKKIALISLLLFVSLTTGCDENNAADSSLEAPLLVAKSNDTAAFEKGIRAWPGSSLYPGRGIRIEWHSVKTASIGGYSVYRTSTVDNAGQPVSFLKIATLEVGHNIEDTAFIDQTVTDGTRFFYTVAAFERSGTKADGKRSETVDYTLSSAIEGVSPAGSVISDTLLPVFRWKVENGNTGYTVLRVYEVNPVNTMIQNPVWIHAGYPSFTDPSFTYNEDGTAAPLKKGKTYGWYVTQIVPGERNHGSASRMKIFTVQ